MGNRGCLHDDQRRLVRTQASRKDWVTCLLDFRGNRRVVMTPGKYTELFFLDEATALAAGHRPCNECRRERFQAFKAAWLKGVLGRDAGALRVLDIDPVMHHDRLAAKGVQRRFEASIGELPDGVMVQLPGEEGIARLKWRGRLLAWTPAGYERPLAVTDGSAQVTVLTPACTVKVLGAGYVPDVHPSALA
jgi:methylphosphotriester-DNA--protein-cysteine methyltransferase